jgi:hypothetical protein
VPGEAWEQVATLALVLDGTEPELAATLPVKPAPRSGCLGSKAAKLLRSKSHTLVPANFGRFALGSASAGKLLRSKSQAG